MEDPKPDIPAVDAQETALTGREKWYLGIAYVSGGLGILVLLLFGILLMVGHYWGIPTLSLGNSGLVGDFIGGVSGSLFALAGMLLFYLALTLQRKEFQNSLKELRISSAALAATEEHHRDTLRVMSEEKEFNVCLAAIKDLKEEWKDGRSLGSPLLGHWRSRYGEAHFLNRDSGKDDYSTTSATTDIPLPHFWAVHNFAERALWITSSLVEKDISEVDRRYLAVVLIPILRSMVKEIVPAVDEIVKSFRAITVQEKLVIGFKVDSNRMHVHLNEFVIPLKETIQRAEATLARVMEN